MKKIILIMLSTTLLLISCTTTNTAADSQASSLNFSIPKGTEFQLANGVTAQITSFKAVNRVIYYEGNTYTPSGTGNVAFRATIKVTKNTEKGLKVIPYNKLELVTVNDNVELEYSNYTKPNNITAGLVYSEMLNNNLPDALSAGDTITENIYFVYPKSDTPVAITNDRIPVITFYSKSTPNVEKIDSNLAKYPYITECFKMTKTASAEEIEAYMNKYGITYKDKDMNGLPLIVYAIINKNDSVFDKALEESDLSIILKAQMGTDKVDLLGFAALQTNKYACEKLMAKGFNFESTKEKENPLVLAVRNNNMISLRFIVEVLKVDVSDLKIPMAWSGSIDAEKYCRDKNRIEMANYLASKKK